MLQAVRKEYSNQKYLPSSWLEVANEDKDYTTDFTTQTFPVMSPPPLPALAALQTIASISISIPLALYQALQNNK